MDKRKSNENCEELSDGERSGEGQEFKESV